MRHPIKENRPGRRLHRFHGGIHLPDNKAQSTARAVRAASLPGRLILPLQQHIGQIAEPLVAAGDPVLKGQMIARAQGYISAPVHAPSSGTVVEIADHPVPHPSGLNAPCIVIETDGEERWCELPAPISDPLSLDEAEMRARIRDSGIVGLGGAAFPTGVKINPGAGHEIHTLVINGAECEPYITCDDMLMRGQAQRIITGIAISRFLLGARQVLIAIEDNKPEAIVAMRAALDASGMDRAEVVVIPTLYPSGGERQLIQILTGQEVPSGGIPAQIGLVCQNVATAAAISDAVVDGRPLISRHITLTGSGIAEPVNLEALIGTPLNELVEQAGGYTGEAARLILGGPMMGFSLTHDRLPLTKASNCLLAASAEEAPPPRPASACIRCGRCADACPARLLPQQLYWYARSRDIEKTEAYHLFDCIECGCCSHVCPAQIPLVHYFRYAKSASSAQEQERRRAEHARRRHEARMTRLERLEAERKAKLQNRRAAVAKKKTRPKASGEASPDPKQAAIKAAMQRAAEKKARLAREGQAPKNTENLTEAQQRQIDRAEQRRAAPDHPPAED
ncbi:MAG: electron transport complex subunit RsxC [Candidatus Sedimenticola endophacoides]